MVIKDNYLIRLINKCRYFSEEDTKLQYIGRKLGATVERTPKCHRELAGEGIKYTWGRAKSQYHMLKFKYKRGLIILLKSLWHCISHDIITTELFGKYSANSRPYMKSYHSLRDSKLNTVERKT